MQTKGHWVARHKRWGVWGLGRSGIAAANALVEAGAEHVIASDIREMEHLDEVGRQLNADVEVVAGANVLDGCEAIVTSPGLKPSLPVFEAAREQGIPVISEVELAYDLARAPMVAITGTDGKTTTTSLIGAAIEASGREVVVAGNIGTPLCEVVAEVSAEAIIVAEVSAFQLWTTHHFRPAVACLTNIADDHLDYFDGDVDAYARAKHAIIAQMGEGDWLWLPSHDGRGLAWKDAFDGQVGLFGLEDLASLEAHHAMWREGDTFRSRMNGAFEGVWCEDVDALGLSGPHNHRNMLCAAGVVASLGIPREVAREAFRDFKGLPHRFERLGRVRDIEWIDDSKATNAHAALSGLMGIDGAFVAIMGGLDKGLDLTELCAYVAEHAQAVILIGAIAPRLRRALRAAGMDAQDLIDVETMAEAVAQGAALGSAQVPVVLSPACSSFDMYESYAQRGRIFQEAVSALE